MSLLPAQLRPKNAALVRLLIAILLLGCVVAKGRAGSPDVRPPTGVIERTVTLGQGEWAVPAVITLPASAQGVPAVALLHGFGPGSLDADVGPNKIFRDTAWGLARRGVASIRHAKRTSAHASLFRERDRHATVAEEWLDDGRSAVAALRRQPAIDRDRIFVAGHSASASLAAHLALETGAAGAILVSGGASRFQTQGEMIASQANYIAGLAPDDTTAVAEAHRVASEAERLDDPSEPDDAVVLRHPLWYWRELAAYDPVADIATLTKLGRRALIVQGGRDYLVGSLQWSGWSGFLGDNPRVERHMLANLNHVMQPGTAKMRPEEYGEKRQLDPSFLDVVAQWVGKAS